MLERLVRIFKNRLGKGRETMTVPSTACFGLTNLVKRAGLQCLHSVIVAARTLHTVRPASFLQKLLAGFFGGEAVHGFGKCEFRFHGLASVKLRPFQTKPA